MCSIDASLTHAGSTKRRTRARRQGAQRATNSSGARGRSLAVKDKAVLYGAGSSDPRVRFKVTGTKDLHCTSKCIKKSLDPSWRETFSLPTNEGLRRGREADRLRHQRSHPRSDVRRCRCPYRRRTSWANSTFPFVRRRPFFALCVSFPFYATGESSGPLARRRRRRGATRSHRDAVGEPDVIPRSSTPSRSSE